jgi:predicted DNA binding CopG/RHH family protein
MAGGFMKKKIKYTDEPMGKVRVIKDFLPRPEELILKDQAVKVTLNLNRSSVLYFKKLAERGHIPYQKIIRNLLDHYVSHAA